MRTRVIFRVGTTPRIGLVLGMVISSLTLLAFSCTEEDTRLWGSGTIEGTRTVVSARVGAEVLSIHVREGDPVQPDDLLVTLDAEDLQDALEQAQLQSAIRAAQQRLLQAGARTQELRQAEARLRQAAQTRETLRDQFERTERLLTQGSVTRREFEEAHLAYTRAENEHDTAQQALEQLQQLARPEELEVARFQLEQAQITRNQAQRNLERSAVTAPVAARVDRILREPGELAPAGTPLVHLVHTRPASLTVFVPQADLGRVGYDQPVEVRVDAFPEQLFAGHVTGIAEEAEFTPRNIQTRDDRARLVFAVTIEIEDPHDLLRPGMGAEGWFLP